MPDARSASGSAFAAIPSQFPSRPLKGALGGYSTAGRKDRNDDAIAGRVPAGSYEIHTMGILACIADGISTGRNADLAAQIAVTDFTRDYYATPESWAVKDRAARLMSSINDWLYSQNRIGSSQTDGHVTTFTGIVARSTTLHVIHVGDTRCLRLRAGRIACLTEDHTSRHMGSGQVLTRALGVEPDIRVDYLREEMRPGDVYLLTSDGVHDTLAEDRIAGILGGHALTDRPSLEAAARGICDAAHEAGSADNLSCLILSIAELPSETVTEAHRRLTGRAIPPAMSPGNRIDGWVVEDVLHSSTRSHVYLVRRADREGRYVLKAPSQNFAGDLRYLEGFTLEQWVGRRIDDPQVMGILPPDDSRFLYFVAEHIPGETLADWITRNPAPPVQEVHDILASLVRAVRLFHRLGMVHRDLKPANVILSQDATAHIIDFGSVKVAGFSDITTGTEDDLPEGTLNYAAPELVMGRGAGPRSDLYSLAVIAFEMLAGRVPLDLEARAWTPRNAAEWTPAALRDLRPDLPAATARALARALSYDPEDRPAVMTEFLSDLRRSADRRAGPSDFVPLLHRGSRDFWRAWAIAATGIAATLAIALALP